MKHNGRFGKFTEKFEAWLCEHGGHMWKIKDMNITDPHTQDGRPVGGVTTWCIVCGKERHFHLIETWFPTNEKNHP